MSRSVITAVLITTRPVAKYGGVQIPLETLEELLSQLQQGQMPMQMDHKVLEKIDATMLDSRIEQTVDSEHALLVEFEADDDSWAAVEDRWKAAGVPGGFSVALTQHQETVDGPAVSSVRLIADAGAYSDPERAAAAELLSQSAPVEVLRLYQFSELEFAKLVIEFGREAVAALFAGGIMYLVGSHQGSSHVEFRREEPDGLVTTAVLDTADPEIVRAAAERLDQVDRSETPLVFNPDTLRWEER
jgi:hypothetical protein